MKTISYLVIVALSISLLACNELDTNKPRSQKPNILFLIADDLGYGDLHCYGGLSRTPNLDQLAKDGILFTDFYAAAPNCSPSRAGLMTGKNPATLGMYNYRPPKHPMHLRDSEVTIAEVLQEQGYQTTHIGKWHLGCLPQDSVLNHPQPIDQGFEYSLGTENNAQPSHLNPVNFVRNGKPLQEQQGYSCQILAEEAINWFEHAHEANDPFFMYLAFHEPHAKVASPPELIAHYPDQPQKDAEYLANIENLDIAIGRVIKYLTDNQLLENTFILFSSDNGSYRQASNGPLRAVKSYLYEGGIHVPGIVHWPSARAQETVIDAPAGFVDLMPTICDLVNIKDPYLQELDGTSILPLLNGEEFKRNKPLYWYFYRTSPEIAMRLGSHMILGRDQDSVPRTHRFSTPDMSYIKEMDLSSYELYDVSEDEGQRNNIIATHSQSERYKELLDHQLQEIQENGYTWPHLPAADGKKKIKTDWVPYRMD